VSRRSERVAEEIREEVARMIAGGELKDPRIGFVTVTRVAITPDLRTARVLVGVLGEPAQRDATLAALRRAAGFVRRELGRRIRMRHTPELIFQYDAGIAATERVAQLLDEVRPAGDEARPAGDEGRDDEPEG
jgi:ribosome-binding factor A